MNLEEKTVSRQTLLQGIVFDVERIEVELGDGSSSRRDIVRHMGGVGVLARNPEGHFLLVKQYRKAVESLSLEIVAGMREAGEDALVTGERELLEETGCRVKSMHYLGRFLPSPGYTDEVDELYFAEVESPEASLKLDADERLVVESFSRSEMESMIRENKISDGKSIAAWYFAKDRGLL
ncbi:MAG: NUDIX hydrolase [Kiritimatiellia bacterium]